MRLLRCDALSRDRPARDVTDDVTCRDGGGIARGGISKAGHTNSSARNAGLNLSKKDFCTYKYVHIHSTAV